MDDVLLTIVKLCLLALLYLFFFRVLQATWFGSTTNIVIRRVDKAKRHRGQQRSEAQRLQLVVLEPSRDAGQKFIVTGELTIGRASDCQLVFDDTYMSQLHARIAPNEGGLSVEDLGSTNGTYVNRQRVTAPTIARVGDRVQFGGVVLELR